MAPICTEDDCWQQRNMRCSSGVPHSGYCAAAAADTVASDADMSASLSKRMYGHDADHGAAAALQALQEGSQPSEYEWFLWNSWAGFMTWQPLQSLSSCIDARDTKLQTRDSLNIYYKMP